MIDNIQIAMEATTTVILLYILFNDKISSYKHKLWIKKMKKQGKEYHL